MNAEPPRDVQGDGGAYKREQARKYSVNLAETMVQGHRDAPADPVAPMLSDPMPSDPLVSTPVSGSEPWRAKQQQRKALSASGGFSGLSLKTLRSVSGHTPQARAREKKRRAHRGVGAGVSPEGAVRGSVESEVFFPPPVHPAIQTPQSVTGLVPDAETEPRTLGDLVTSKEKKGARRELRFSVPSLKAPPQ